MFTLDTCRSSIDRRYRAMLGQYLGQYSTDISADTRARYRMTLGRASVDIFFKLVDCRSPLSVDTWLVCRSTLGRRLDRYPTMNCRRHIGQPVVEYWSTFGGILCIVNRLFC